MLQLRNIYLITYMYSTFKPNVGNIGAFGLWWSRIPLYNARLAIQDDIGWVLLHCPLYCFKSFVDRSNLRTCRFLMKWRETIENDYRGKMHVNSEWFHIIVDQSGLQTLTLIPTPNKLHGITSYGPIRSFPQETESLRRMLEELNCDHRFFGWFQ